MEKKLDRWLGVMLGGILCIVVVFIISPTDQDPDGTYNDPVHKALRWANSFSSEQWVAFFTGVLTTGTLGMWFVMWRTLRATKASVDAQINGQRGKLVFINGSRIQIPPQPLILLGHTFQNIGAGRLLVKSFRRDMKTFKVPPGTHVKPDYELPYLPAPAKDYEETIPIAKPIVLIELGYIETIPQAPGTVLDELQVQRKLSDEKAGALKDGKILLVQYAVTYETAFGEYELRCAWLTRGAQGIYARRVSLPGYESDLPVKK